MKKLIFHEPKVEQVDIEYMNRIAHVCAKCGERPCVMFGNCDPSKNTDSCEPKWEEIDFADAALMLAKLVKH